MAWRMRWIGNGHPGAAARQWMAMMLACALPLSLAAPAFAVDGHALAVQQRCIGCHQVDSREVGPPFRAIAQRFGHQPQAADYLAGVIRRGSSGQWGAIPMPAQRRVSPEDALALAHWILSLDTNDRGVTERTSP